MKTGTDNQPWRDVVQFWFPEGLSLSIDADTHKEYWLWRMQGGADEEIRARFKELTMEGAAGGLNHWACHPEGRLALIIVLDQFPRSVWRGTGRAFAQDPAALTLVLEGLSNGHYAALGPPWFKIVQGLPLGHCEGEDHLGRLDLLIRLRTDIAATAPAQLQPIYRSLVKQADDVKQVIANFGRHPHRNKILGRQSTAAEEAYLTKGRFPHLRAFQG